MNNLIIINHFDKVDEKRLGSRADLHAELEEAALQLSDGDFAHCAGAHAV